MKKADSHLSAAASRRSSGDSPQSEIDPKIQLGRHRMAAGRTAPTIGLEPDWIVVALPTALATRVFNINAPILIIAFLMATAFIRKPEGKFPVQAGPLICLFAASAIVFSRSDSGLVTTIFVLSGVLVTRLVRTVDARRIIASLIDGFGLYLLANVLCEVAGIRSSEDRSSNLTESTGFTRILFPLTQGLNTPSIIAGAYLIASIFFVREAGWLRRSLRMTCAASAIIVIVGIGSRTALAATVLLSIAVVLFPFTSRWIAQAATLVAAVSAFVLPSVINAVEFAVTPLTSLAPGRENTESDVVSLQGREYIWNGAIKHWNEHVHELPDILLGFGQSGQFKSGASLTYLYVVRGLGPHPERASLHNSFLQQLFDGGVLGWLLLALATYWASVRLSERRSEWGHWGLSAIFVLTAALLGSMTEATMAPGLFAESFWLLLVLIGAACQSSRSQSENLRSPPVVSTAGNTSGIQAPDT